MRVSQRPSGPQGPLLEQAGQAHVTQPKFKGEGEQLCTLDGEPFYGLPDRVNAMGYPSAGGRRLYTAEHLHRRGRPIRQATPPAARSTRERT